MMDTQRIIALVVFSFSSLLLWDAWQKHNAPKLPATPPSASVQAGVPVAAAPPAVPAAASVPGTSAPPTAGAPPAVPAPATTPGRAGETVNVRTDLFDVDIGTLGGDIRRVTLLRIYSALDRTKPLTLMEPSAKHYFVTQSGLLGEGLPTHLTPYIPEARSYTIGSGDAIEVRMKAVDASGAEVTKKYVFRRGSYLIDVSYEVRNRSELPLSTTAYFQFMRDANSPSEEAAQTNAFAGVTTFTGPAVYTTEAKFTKVSFDDVAKGKPAHPTQSKDGWIAMIQHYFVSAWLPKEGVAREYYTSKVADNRFTAGVKVPMGTVAPGASGSITVPVYIGPQETETLEKLAPGLDLVVDYGWLLVIAKPLFLLLKWIHDNLVHNWGWAIILLTILIKAVFYPLNAKAGRSMAQMKVLGPKMEKLKQLYGDDRQKMNQAMMELYRTEKINPLGGCLPILVQIPVFIALYWVLLASIELRHAPWLGWIQDLSAPDPYFILPVIYAVSMFVQTKLNPQPADPVQAKVMLAMPIVFSVFFLFFPSGLVLYWVVQNLLSIVQQWHINRTLEKESKAKVARR